MEKPLRRNTFLRHAQYFQQLLTQLDDQYWHEVENSLQATHAFDLNWPQIQHAWQWLIANLHIPQAVELCNQLPRSGVYLLSLRLPPIEQIQWIEQGLQCARQLQDTKSQKAHLGNLGDAYREYGDLSQAMAYCEVALQLIQVDEIPDEMISIHIALGRIYIGQSRYDEAQTTLEKALTIAQNTGDVASEATVLSDLGVLYSHLAEYETTKDLYDRADNLRTDRTLSQRATRQLQWGNLHGDLNQAGKAINAYQAALKLAQQGQNQKLAGSILGQLSSVYYTIGDIHQAKSYSLQALALHRASGGKSDLIIRLNSIATLETELDEYESALAYLQESLAFAEELNQPADISDVLENLGVLYTELEDYEQAVECYERALALVAHREQPQATGHLMANLAVTYQAQDDYGRAIEYLEKSVEIARDFRDVRSEGIRLGSLGNAFMGLEQYDQAIMYHRQALAISKQVGDRLNAFSDLYNLGSALAQAEHYEEAIQCYRQALRLNSRLQLPAQRVMVLERLRVMMVETDQLPQAIRYTGQIIALLAEEDDPSKLIDYLYTKSDLELEVGKFQAAARSCRQGIRIAQTYADTYQEYVGTHRLGIVYDRWGKSHLATAHYQTAITLAVDMQDYENQAQSLNSLAVNYALQSNYPAAITVYDKALAFTEQHSLNRSTAEILLNYGITFFEQQQINQALTCWQRAHSLSELHNMDDLLKVIEQMIQEAQNTIGP